MMNLKNTFNYLVVLTTVMMMIIVQLMPTQVLKVSASSLQPIAWSEVDNSWIPYLYADGTVVRDPASDVNPIASDITSGIDRGVGNLPSIYVATKTVGSETHLFFRMRVKGDPYDRKGGFTSTAYLVQLWTQAGFLATIGLDGKPTSSDYVYVANASGSVFTKVYETSTTLVNGLTVVPGTRITPAENNHYFIDFQVPLSVINTVLTSGETPITATTPLRLVYGTSQAANLSVINKETINNLDGSTATANDFRLLSEGFSNIQVALVEPSIKITSIGGQNPDSNPSFTNNNITISGTTSIGNTEVSLSLNGLPITTTVASADGGWSFNLKDFIPESSANYLVEVSINQAGVTYVDSKLFNVSVTLEIGSNLTIDGGQIVYRTTSPLKITGSFILSNASYNIRTIITSGSSVVVSGVATKSDQRSGTWTYPSSTNLSLSNGEYLVTVEAYSQQGVYARATQTLIIDSTLSSSNLNIKINAVDSTNASRPGLSGTVEDATKIDIRLNNKSLTTITPTTSTGSSTWNMSPLTDPLPSGNYTFSAIAYGANGDIAVATTSYSIAAQASDLAIAITEVTNPSDPSKPGLTGSVISANRIEISLNGSIIDIISTTNTATSTTWTMDPLENPLAPGTYTFLATAYDVYGTSTSASITHTITQDNYSINIDNGPVLKSSDNQPTFTGTTNAINGSVITLTLTKDGITTTHTALVSNGRWRIEWLNTISDGEYDVRATINGIANVSDQISFILDTTPPVLNLVGSSTIEITYGSLYTDLGAQAFDNIDGDITAFVITSNFVNTNQLGEYKVYYNVNDSAGNAAEQVERTVEVVPKPLTLVGSTGGAALATVNDVIIGSTVELIASNSSVIATTVAATTTVVFEDVPFDTGYKAKMTTNGVVYLSNTADVLAAADTTAPILGSVDDDDIPIAEASYWIAPTTTAFDNIDGDLSNLIEVTYSSPDSDHNVTNLESARTHLTSAANNKIVVTYTVTDKSNNTATTSATFTSIGSEILSVSINGCSVCNQQLYAVLDPLTATATYQWYRSDDQDGWIAVSTGASYIVTEADIGSFIKVEATGTGNYTGVVSATTTNEVSKANPPQAPQPPTVTTVSTTTITIVTIIGQEYKLDDGNWFVANGPSYTFENLNVNTPYQIVTRIAETPTVQASASSEATTVSTLKIPLTSISAIIGTIKSGETVTAGVLTPSDATVTYQWQRFNPDSGEFVNIDGATDISYTITTNDIDTTIRVVASGINDYEGIVSSTESILVPLLDGPVKPTAPVILSVSATTITVIVITGQEYSVDGGITWNTTGVFTDLNPNEPYQVITRIKATNTTNASQISDQTTATTSKLQVVSIDAIVGTLRYGVELTAGSLTPSLATVTYQWQRSSDGQTWSNISGATSNKYVLTELDIDHYIQVVATGTGNYEGLVSTSRTTKVLKQIPKISRIILIDFEDITTTSFTVLLDINEDFEYSIGNDPTEDDWQDSATFTGLTPNTEYKVNVRIKETETTEAVILSFANPIVQTLPINNPPQTNNPPSPTIYTVDFVDYDNSLIESKTVVANNPITPPSLAKGRRIGHIFTGWSIDLSNISANLTAQAQYNSISAEVIEQRTNILAPKTSNLFDVVSFSEEELNQDVSIRLELDLLQTPEVPADDKNKIIDFITKLRPNQNVLAKFLDITLIKQVGDQSIFITNLPRPITISFVVAEEFRNTPFVLVRVHEGELDQLPYTYDAQTFIISFETDRFSTYALLETSTDQGDALESDDTDQQTNTGSNPSPSTNPTTPVIVNVNDGNDKTTDETTIPDTSDRSWPWLWLSLLASFLLVISKKSKKVILD